MTIRRISPNDLTASIAQPVRLLAFFLSAAARRDGSRGEPDLTGVRRVITGKLRRPRSRPPLPEKADQRLDRGAEIAALPHQQSGSVSGPWAEIRLAGC